MITVNEYARYAGKSIPLTNQAQVEAAIDAATSMIENAIDRDLYECSPSPLDAVEIFSGRGTFRMWTKNAPIDDVDTIEYWTGTEWQDVSELGMTFTFVASTGEVYFPERYVFHKGTENWRITYSYGYTTLPDDLKYACFLLTKYFIDKQSRQGISSQSDGEQSFTYVVNEDVPKDYTAIIESYRRPY